MPDSINQRLVRRLLTCLPVIFLAGCAASTDHPADGGLIHRRNEGYSLLFKLMGDESDVGEIFFIKHADDSVGNLVREVGQTCKEAKAQLQAFAKTDDTVEFDEPDLPLIEQRSRKLTADWETRELLTSGEKDFELRLIFTQAQAMSYASELCKALYEIESDPSRKAFLSTLADRCDRLYDRLMALLTVKL
ncbi:MAG: hypothetical protein ABSF29_06960 [Tepidisphaeraceae bacterium]|jgi:hypothetical protein